MSSYDFMRIKENKNSCEEKLISTKVDDESLSEICGGQANYRICPRCGALVLFVGDNIQKHERECKVKLR